MSRFRTSADRARRAGRAIAGAMLAALVACSSSAAAKASAGPKAVAVDPIHDFGALPTGAPAVHAFTLRNDGSAPLLLREIRSDCACTAASYDQTIAPASTGEVRIALDTAELSGPLVRTITVLTNDPATPSIALTVKADVRPVLVLKPGYARYSHVQKETAGLIGQTLYAADGADFRVLSVESPYPYLAASFREAAAAERIQGVAGRQWRVETALSPEAPAGGLSDWVTIKTDHPRQRSVRLAISGIVNPPITVTPPAAELGPRSLAYPKLGSLTVKVHATEQIPVTRVDTDVEGLQVELKPLVEGRSYRVEMRLTPQLPKGDFRGSVRIHTDSPKAPLLEVPISGRLE